MLGKTEDNKTFYALCMMNFLLYMEWGISTSMLPIYIHENGGSPIEVGLVFTVFAGISIFSRPLWGIISDYFGRRKILIVFGMVSLVPIFLLMNIQKEILHLILLRGSTAIFKGAVIPITWALVSDISLTGKIGSNMGVLNFFEMAGFAVGPIIGGLVIDMFGFPTLWFFVAIECLIGAVIFLILGSDPQNISRSTEKFFIEAFRKLDLVPKLSKLYISFFVCILGIALIGPNLNIYLFDNLGFSRTMIGVLSFTGVGVAALIQPIIGSYSDRYGRRPFLIVGALCIVFGNIVLFLFKDLSLIIVAQILLGNQGIFQFIGSAYITDVIPQKDTSSVLGLLSSVGSFSRALGAVLGGYIITVTNTSTLILVSTVFPIISGGIVFFFLKESMKMRSKKDKQY